jgi:hypothetical protein
MTVLAAFWQPSADHRDDLQANPAERNTMNDYPSE